ncbi:BUD22-domain-containing protein [Boletus reticuloceps]|uniref:BUD22-domain-containing protein n=1 Tax=Boletus reticuloceps TaxID=495285 RepID=A0A8I2YRZ9_9AGAM|nr:BUD22-domain-containing protein [Boletus reticuloceps]
MLSILKHYALRELRKIVKKARTFEVQRSLKKLKEARHKDPESDVTRDLEAQMEILKVVAPQLRPTCAIGAHERTGLKSAFTRAPGTPAAKVQSRMLSSRVLASEVTSIAETLRTFLHPAAGLKGIGEATNSSHASPNTSKKRRTGIGHEKAAFSSKDKAVDPSGGGSNEGYENPSGDEAVGEADDDWEFGTVEIPSESDDSVAGAADDHAENSSEANFPSEDAQSTISRAHGSRGQSEFFPSLSVGFTRGDSGSEFSDSEAKFVDGIRKNRRGQRARRAIWEKKFGKNANHIKEQQQHTERRQSGSVPVDRRSGKGNPSSRPRGTSIRPCTPTYGHVKVRRPTSRRSEGVKNLDSTGGQSERIQHKGDLRGKQGEPPLHPSWEAKRKQKSASIVPSQGTKIVFSGS